MRKSECISALGLTKLQKRHMVNHIDSLDNPPAMRNDRVRTTISIEPEIHDAFVAMANKQGVSVSRWMGDWLATTVESAQFISYKMDALRRAPAESMKALHDKTIAEMQSYPATVPKTPPLVIRGVIKSEPVANKKEKP